MYSRLRSDELARESEIEKARERDEKIRKGLKIAKNVGSAALGIGGAALSARILPFLSEAIPEDLAIKGINKIAPNIGKLFDKGKKLGLDIKEGLNFLRNNLMGTESQQNAQQNQNIIEQYSPELFQFLNKEIQGGRSPLEAGAIAELNGGFKPVIEKMKKDHKTTFAAILQSIFGSGQNQGNQMPAQQQQPQPQQGQGSQALQAILEKINKLKGG